MCVSSLKYSLKSTRNAVSRKISDFFPKPREIPDGTPPE